MTKEQFVESVRLASEELVNAERTDAALSVLAATKTIACYSDVAPVCGHHHRDAKFWTKLGESMRRDHAAGVGLRCSLIVNKQQGIPGASYFDMARSLGMPIAKTYDAELAFWRSQLQKLSVPEPEWVASIQASAAT